MKVRNPRSRFDLNIKKSDRVLEVGGGHNPHPRSNVVVDKFVDSNYHRSANIKVLRNQQFMQADGENLPFKDKEFDYVICNQVLEHVENPARFLSEQFRVAKRGYIETPSLLGELLTTRDSHKWLINEFNNRLYLVDKTLVDFEVNYNLTCVFQLYLPKHSIGFKIMERTHPNLLTARIEWEHEGFDYEINPKDPEILKYFKTGWDDAWKDQFFPPRSMGGEFMASLRAFSEILWSVFKSKLLGKGDHTQYTENIKTGENPRSQNA